MSISSTVALLQAWGRWGASINLGYPRVSVPFGNVGSKTSLYAETGASPEILHIDKAVATLELDLKRLLIERYQWHKMWFESSYRNLSKATYYRHLEKAHWAVHIAISG